MRALIMGHKKLCIAIFAVLLVLVVFVLSFLLFKPKLSNLSDSGLKIFLWFNGIKPEQDKGWSEEGLASIREFIKNVEECPDWFGKYFPTLMRNEKTHFYGYLQTPSGNLSIYVSMPNFRPAF